MQRAAVQKWECGTVKNLKRETIKKLSEIFNVPPSSFIDTDYTSYDNIVSFPKMNRIPLVGTIACGTPILANENLDGEVTVPEDINADFALRCKGDSMIDARIHNGDIVYIRKLKSFEEILDKAHYMCREPRELGVYVPGEQMWTGSRGLIRPKFEYTTIDSDAVDISVPVGCVELSEPVQLPGYGGNMDTAASDLMHYQKLEYGSLVLCGSRRRAELLQEMLRSKNISALLCIPLTTLPKPGQILLAEGTLPYGMEYPTAKLAVLTEGQLIARTAPKKKAAKK